MYGWYFWYLCCLNCSVDLLWHLCSLSAHLFSDPVPDCTDLLSFTDLLNDGLRTFSLCNCGSQNYATMQAYNFVHSWPFFTLFGSKPHVIDLISCNSLCLNDFQWPYVCFWLYFNIEQKQRLFVCVHLDSKATLFIGHYKENVIIELNFLNRFTWKMAVKTERETNGQMFVFA